MVVFSHSTVVFPALRRAVRVLCGGAIVAWSLAQAAADVPDIPLGPLGGTCAPVEGTCLVKVLSLRGSAPGRTAGLRTGDFIRGTDGVEFGVTSENPNDGYIGAIQDLAMALDRAEGNGGHIVLNVIRSGTGGLDLAADVGSAGSFGPAWPAGSAKADAIYDWCCEQIHSKVHASATGSFGYNSGWFGIILLSHPNWNDTGGAKPYRPSIDKLRTHCENDLNARELEPKEQYYWNGSAVVPNPGYRDAGLENWDVCTNAMFLALYRIKTGDTTADAVVQRAAEMIAHRVQTWNQYDDQNAPHVLGGRIGRMGHGGVVGDYSRGGHIGALNIINAHALLAMGLLKMAGADMDKNLGRSVNSFDYDTEKLTPTIEEKFRYCWNMVRNATRTDGGDDDGNVGYVTPQSGWDSAGRTSGCLAGWNIYGLAPDATDSDRLARQAAYIPLHWSRQQHAHAYTLGGVVLSQLSMPFLADRGERFFQENTSLYAELALKPDNSVAYFPGRRNNGGDAYLNCSNVALINAAMPRAIRSGNLPGFPAPDPARILVWMRSPANSWPALEARHAKLTGGLDHTLDVAITDIDGAILAPSEYSATWTQIHGPGTASFSAPNSAATDVSFSKPGTYRVQLVATRGTYTLTEPWDFDVIADPPPAGTAPRIVTQPISRSAVQGDTVSFSVDVQGTGPFVYQWLRNDQNIGSVSSDPQFTIESVSAGSAGDYHCLVTTPYGTAASDAATLHVDGVGAFKHGGLWRDVFTGISGKSVFYMTRSPNYPNLPDASGMIPNAESPTNYGDNYGERWSGWITPPESGYYRFYIACDDRAELWISTTDKRADRVRVARETGWRSERNYPNSTTDESTSPQLHLLADHRYYIELLHKEGTSNDNAAVTWNWKSPGVWATPAAGSEPLPGAVLEYQEGGTLDDNVAPPDNYPPTADGQSLVLYGAASTSVTLTGDDFENAPLTFVVTRTPAKGTLSGTPPNLSYTPNPGESGTDTFAFKVNDGTMDSDEAEVFLSLVPESGGDLKVWDGSTNNLWTSRTNWTGNATPDSNDAVIFNASSVAHRSTSLHANTTISRIVVENPAGSVSIADHILTLTGGIEMLPARANLTVSSEISIGAAQEWSVRAKRTLTHTGALSGASPLTKTGAGTLLLKAAGTLSGGITVEEGTLELNGGGWGKGPCGGTGTLTVNQGATAINAKYCAFSGANNPDRDIALDGGRFRLKKETYIADISMTAGTIDNMPDVSSEIRPRSLGGSLVTVNAADTPSLIACRFRAMAEAHFDVADGAADPDFIISGELSDRRAVTKDGHGRMTLSGNSPHTGTFDVLLGSLTVTGTLASPTVNVHDGGKLEGTGILQGTVDNNGRLSPGVDGIATISIGDLSQSASGSCLVELAGTANHDQIAVTGSATLDGTLDVALADGFTPSTGDSFVVLTCASRTGTFSTVNLPTLPADREWNIAYDPDGTPGVGLSVAALTPYGQWRKTSFGAEADDPATAGEHADPDGDGIDNLLEYALNLNPNLPANSGGAPGRNGLPGIETPDENHIALVYRRNISATDIAYVVEESDDLGLSDPWSAAPVAETILSDDGETRIIRATIPRNGAPGKFLRLKVTK